MGHEVFFKYSQYSETADACRKPQRWSCAAEGYLKNGSIQYLE
ncbi:hypothetical protein HMPREF9371_0275 [Neisseria shayeganii 871]|uniref:Uncharacterized protein n=1 Tax=Neisseria shayeganii 871 TaxID=1032488 RepID=G4CF86_9NEIS|nr:hypothetical protein HMPREF9371_0275 [Neisseria shayeganii 871]